MRNKILTAGLALIITVFVGFPLVVTAMMQARTLTASTPDELRAAISAARFGDTILLKAGAVFDSAVPFDLPDKGTPPTGTAADYITITVDDETAIPEKLRNYAPGNHPVITAAEAARMPKIRTTSPYPAINFPKGSKYWKLRGIEVTNVDSGGMVPRLISGDLQEQITDYKQLPDHLTLEMVYAHPVEETGAPMNADNIKRSVENTLMLDATNVLITKSAFQGFAGMYKYREVGNRITSANIMATLGEHWRVENTLLQAWTYSVFLGGGGMPKWAVTDFATVSNCQGNPATQCDFSNTTGLTAGKPIAVYVSTSTSANKWGGAFVDSISGSTVKFKQPLCQTFTGGNSCTAQNGTPANGDRAQWGGHQPTDYVFEWNTWEHPLEWKAQLGACGGKGYAEFKSVVKLTINGNDFKGCSGFTTTVRNQNGDFPWASLDDFHVTNNYFENGNSPFVFFAQDALPTKRSRGALFYNNLVLDPSPNLSADIPGGLLSLNFSNGDDITITHNTVPWKPTWRMFNTYDTINTLRIQDNIFSVGQNSCYWGNTGTPISQCWLNATNDHNVLVNLKTAEELKAWWLDAWPNQFVVTSWNDVGFVRVNDALDKTSRFELAATSPFKGKASDNTDPGVNYPQLIANLRFDPNGGAVSIPSPTVTPTPSPSVSPSPLPSIAPTPSPTPAPSPSPSIPSGSKVQIVSPANVREQPTINSAVKFIAPTGEQGTSGACQQDPSSANSYCAVTFVDSTNGYVAAQYLSVVAAPLPSPSPSPSPLPSPTIQPTPAPSPTPAPTPSPTPLPTPTPSDCLMTVNSPVIPQWSSGKLVVTLTGLTQAGSVTVTSTSGQVTVSPPQTRLVSPGSMIVEFGLVVKKKSSGLTVSGPCGPAKSVMVNVQ